ncbi:peptidylprolyl isomerase [Ruegeria arenilitoris]|uniref:peptidylprolyl isomerase n=1 Tax=Ruegeria arenilitoris TaxID=1173585 RepID=UPI001481BA8F|nr:peptidylprolyl isomerase [Ruegeria arenilitoris]
MKHLLREPLVHFLVLGTAIFGLFAAFNDMLPPAGELSITVTRDDARRLATEFEATWRRAPNAEELDRLIEFFIDQEVYVREAKALGLDQDDTIVRRRLQMKMEFLTETGAQGVEPDDAILADHLAANAGQFSRAPVLNVEQVYLGDIIETERVAQIASSLNNGRDPVTVGERGLLPEALRSSPATVVDGIFGQGFFDKLMVLPQGEWVGPVASTFGQHLVRVTARRAESLPPLDEIREEVLQHWRADLIARLREERLQAMRARYEITRPDAAQVVAE